MNTLVPSTLLRAALVLDVVGSGAVAVLQVAGGDALAARTGIPTDLLVGTGIFMLVYVTVLAVLATRPRVPTFLIGAIVAGNTAWSVATLAVVMGSDWALSSIGAGLVGVHVVGVLLFAALQYLGLRRSQPAAFAGAAHAV